jgi:uncharacterized phosphatase
MKHLYFCRHGLSQAQADNAWGGQNDSPLTETGHVQAHVAGRELKQAGTQIDLIICSPLSRARNTALTIAGEIGFPPDQIITDDRFIERTFGIFDGHGPVKEWFDDHEYRDLDDIEGSETVEQLQARAAEGYEFLRSLPHENILLVGHGAFGRGLIRTINGRPYTDEFEVASREIMSIIPNAKVIQLV